MSKTRGGAVKKAPPGYYTAREAMTRLGLNASTFHHYVRQGKIKKYTPPLRTEGFYEQKEIDRLAREVALFFHTEAEASTTETRIAEPQDAQGIYDVLDSFGWQTASVQQRLNWYAVNAMIDYVVLVHGEVVGYITAVPYTEEMLEAMMSGKKRAWYVTPEDILPYQAGRDYNLYVGIATKAVPHRTIYAFRLLSGFMDFLETLAEQNIRIHRMYAVSDQPDGQKLCEDLGFIRQAAKPDDRFPRYVLDLKQSDSYFAKQYRKHTRS